LKGLGAPGLIGEQALVRPFDPVIGKQIGIRNAAREGNDLRPVEQLQQLPNFGGGHTRHARGIKFVPIQIHGVSPQARPRLKSN
jgi:hypothetical protein